jgi:DNA-binding GntR family transcriptional regulator
MKPRGLRYVVRKNGKGWFVCDQYLCKNIYSNGPHATHRAARREARKLNAQWEAIEQEKQPMGGPGQAHGNIQD